jgi:hypothetical protein
MCTNRQWPVAKIEHNEETEREKKNNILMDFIENGKIVGGINKIEHDV